MAATKTLVQPDLFGGAPTVVARVVEAAAPPPPARRKVATTSRDAYREIREKIPTMAERCRWDIAGNGKFGRTRQELADRTGIKLQSVCGCVARLQQDGKIFEPVIGFDAQQRPIHYRRDGRNVLVDALYQDTFDWLAFGQLLHREPAA